MPNGPVDPASLEGDDLVQWYRRSPWQVDQDRQALRRQQYNDFFGIPSQEDRQKAFEAQQKAINPNWKSGDPFVI